MILSDRFTRRDLLRLFARASVGATLSGTLGGCSRLERDRPKRPANVPNIIVILVDDLGVQELPVTGNPFNETPNLDVLAKGGMTFTQAYAAAPVCSPTRASFLTGLYPARTGVTDFLKEDDPNYLSPEHLTLNEALKSVGYKTGFIGKWHLTGDYSKDRGKPAAHGWDEVRCSETRYIANGDYTGPYSFMPGVAAPEGEFLTDRLYEEAISFVERRRDEPFFLYLSHYAVHTVLQGKPEKVAKYEAKPGAARHNAQLAAMLESIDEGVGRLVRALEANGLLEDTLLIFTSDNGGDPYVASPSPLRGTKSQLYEGGIRVPFIAHWPRGVLADTTCDAPISTVDLFPTFAQLASFDSSLDLDGVSLRPLFNGQGLAPRTLYWHYPRSHPHPNGGRSAGAVRQGDHKLIEFYDTGETELYDLAEDVGETHDLSAVHPEVVRTLRSQIGSWRASAGAVPT